MVLHHLNDFEELVERHRVGVVLVNAQVERPDVLALGLVEVVGVFEELRENAFVDLLVPD